MLQVPKPDRGDGDTRFQSPRQQQDADSQTCSKSARKKCLVSRAATGTVGITLVIGAVQNKEAHGLVP